MVAKFTDFPNFKLKYLEDQESYLLIAWFGGQLQINLLRKNFKVPL